MAWSLENSLINRIGINPMIDPITGEPVIPIPENSAEEKALAKKLAPTKPPEVTLPKTLAPLQMPVPDSLLGKDTMNLDKEMIKRLLLEERSGIEQLSANAQQFRSTPTEVNWKPLASFVGTMVRGGDKLADAFPDVDTHEQRLYKSQQLENMVQNQRGDLTKNALALLQQEAANQVSARQANFAASQEKRLFDQARKEQSTLIKDASEFRNSYKSVEDAITPDASGTVSVGRLSQSLTAFAKLMGEKGVLTDTDIGRQLSPTLEMYKAKFAAMVLSDPNQRVDAQTVSAMKEALTTAKQAFAENYKMKADIYTQGYFDNPGSPYAGHKWAPKLIEDTYKPLKSIEDTGTKPGGSTLPTSDEIAAEIARRQGKK